MRIPEERVLAVRARMDALRRARERRKTGILGMGSALLALCLLLVIGAAGAVHPGGTAGLYSGAIMLFENAGGYVLVAVLAFMAGVVITAALLRRQFKRQDDKRMRSL